MLAKRIIPLLLHRGPTLVKGKQFASWRSCGTVQSAMSVFAARGCDELMLLDIGATPARRGPDVQLIRSLTDSLFCPLTVGGGVRSVRDAELLLANGADRIAVCSAAIDWRDPLIPKLARRLGSQAVVAVIEYRNTRTVGRRVTTGCGRYEWVTHPADLACRYEDQGAGEIVMSSVDNDGQMLGYDIDLIRFLSHRLTIPLVIAGGCGSYDHMLQAIKAGADGVAAGAMFQWTDATPRGAAKFLHEHGMEVRYDHEGEGSIVR
jgi:cyclase